MKHLSVNLTKHVKDLYANTGEKYQVPGLEDSHYKDIISFQIDRKVQQNFYKNSCNFFLI